MAEQESYVAAVPLTRRETEILNLLCEGIEGRRAIATQLKISMNTVAFHLKSIYSKLGVGNRYDAVRVAAQVGVTTSVPVMRPTLINDETRVAA